MSNTDRADIQHLPLAFHRLEAFRFYAPFIKPLFPNFATSPKRRPRMYVATLEDLEGMKRAGEAVAQTLRKMQAFAQPGMSTLELDEYGRRLLEGFGADPAPSRDYGFPGCACICVNEEACHGIPSAEKILKEGDLVNIDVSAAVDGYYGDNGGSFILGKDLQNLGGLVQASMEILRLAIPRAKHGVRIADLGAYIEQEAKKRGLRVIRNLCGHGIGRSLHESPEEVPCFRDVYNTDVLHAGTAIALETFISTQSEYVYELEDGWTMVGEDGGFIAQHEHTLLITEDFPVVLTRNNGIPYQ